MGELPTYDEKSALLVVDVENDFADPNGSLHVEGGEQILPLVNHEIDRPTGAGAFVVYTQDWLHRRRRISRFMAGSGPCIVCATPGARTSTPS